MKQKKMYFLLSFFILFIVGCNKDGDFIEKDGDNSQPLNLSAVTLLDVSYGSDTRNIMDVFLPKNRTSETSVLILIHGGSWFSGDKSSMHPLADAFMESQEMAVVCINYRFIPTYSLPAQMEDIDAVISTIRTKQPEWHTANNKFYLMGVSAGAHLSLLYAYGYDQRHVVQGTISMCGPTYFDLPELFEENPAWEQIISILVGASYEENPDAWRQASPYCHVTEHTCPTILAHCEDDEMVPYSQATMLYDKLIEKNVATQFFSYPEGGHAFEGVDLTEILDASEMMILRK